MDVTLERIYRDALELSDDAKAGLAERLVDYLATHMPPELERQHLDIIRKRSEQILSGQATPISGPEALEQARRKLRE